MKKLFAALITVTTLACTFASCGDKPEKKASNSSSEAVSESSDTEDSGYESYEDAIGDFYRLMAEKDYDGALSVKMPKNIRDLIWFTLSQDSDGQERSVDWDEEVLDEQFGDWDYFQKLTFEEIADEIPLDEQDIEQILDSVNAEFYAIRKAAESYEVLPEPEVLGDKIDELIEQTIDRASGKLKTDLDPEYEHASEVRQFNIRLSDSHDINYFHTVLVYFVDGEGWFLLDTDETETEDDWYDSTQGIGYIAEEIYPAAADVLNAMIGSNEQDLAMVDWTANMIISPDPELCYNFDQAAAKAVCEGIAEKVEGIGDVDYFVVLGDNGIQDVVIAKKDEHKFVRIFPSGLIELSDDDYVNASDMTFEQAHELTIQKME